MSDEIQQVPTATPATPVQETPIVQTPASNDDAPVDLSAFDKLLTQKQEVPQAKEAKTEPTSETPKEEVKPTTTPEPVVTKPASRDYSGFTADEITILKKMSNDAFDHIRPRLLEHKESQKKIAELEAKVKESSVVQPPADPSGYMLDPQYQQSASITQRANQEISYWKTQYQKIRAGEDWEDIVPDGKGGLMKVTRPADADGETELIQRITYGNQLINQHSQFMRNMESGYAEHYKGLVGNIRSVEDKYFPQWAKAEEAMKNEHVKSMHQALVSFKQQNNPLGGMLSKLYASFMEAQDKIAKLEAAAKATPKPATPAVKASGPSSSEMEGNTSLGEEKLSDTLDAFDKLTKSRF